MTTNPYCSALEALMADVCTPQQVRRAEQGHAPAALTEALFETGLIDLMLEEHHGGANASWHELGEAVHLMGKAALPVPLAQTIVARRWLAHNGQLVPGWLSLFGLPLVGATDRYVADLVPFGHLASHVLAQHGGQIHLLPCTNANPITPGTQRGLTQGWSWPASALGQIVAGSALRLHSVAALLQAGLLAGTMEKVVDLTLEHAQTRQQFGQPIAKFQAIQQMLSEMAEHFTAARMATAAAFHTAPGHDPEPLLCAMAKARASEAAALISRHAHAIHGAVGMTADHDLQLYTRRLHLDRWLSGTESYWHTWIGKTLFERPEANVTDIIFQISQPTATSPQANGE